MRISKLRSGDIIFRRTDMFWFAQHAGIVVKRGKELKIIHVYGRNKFNSNIVESTLDDFSQGKEIKVIIKFDIAVPEKKEIARRAIDMYKNKPKEYKYSLGRNNCQHFVMRCLGYEGISPQQKLVDKIFSSLSGWLMSCIITESIKSATNMMMANVKEDFAKIDRFEDLGISEILEK